jgi:DNA end-binding protein Ku
MAARSTGSTTISFGLVSIPVKIYTATHSEGVSFHMLHKECNTRVKQQLYCPTHDQVIERDDTVKGYEVAKGQYVVFTNEEIRQLEAERTNTIDIVQFVPAETVDFIQIEKTHYLGPDKGGHKAYTLLGHAMRDADVVAIGRYNARGKSYVVMIRPYEKGLALHQLYYADEVNAFSEVDIGADVRLSQNERDLALKLIDQLRVDAFDASEFRDETSDRVRQVAEQKAQGMEIQTAPEQPSAQIIDLFEALKKSLEPGAVEAREQKLAKSEARGTAAERKEPRPRGPKKAEPRAEADANKPEEPRRTKKKAKSA